MRTTLLVLTCLTGLVLGFAGTILVIDGPAGLRLAAIGSVSRSKSPILTVTAVPGRVGGSGKAEVKPRGDGVELKSVFEKGIARTSVDGAAYVHVDGGQLPVMSGLSVTLELDATAEAPATEQALEFQYVQNGLAQSGWRSFPLRKGRETYRFSYAAPTDDRPPSKSDTFWVRSDTSGQGRPLIVNAFRIYLD